MPNFVRRNVWPLALAFSFFLSACAASDPGITTAVKTKLAADDTVKAYQIDVTTKDGVVTLTGTVESAAAKTRAAQLARETDGARSVVDNIVVRPAMPDTSSTVSQVQGALTDAGLTAAVKSKLALDTAVSALAIDVDTRDGVVTLTGRVPTAAAKTKALSLARETSGVKSVTDQLKVGK
jgi:hyperosmotically inducible periplasmic protein